MAGQIKTAISDYKIRLGDTVKSVNNYLIGKGLKALFKSTGELVENAKSVLAEIEKDKALNTDEWLYRKVSNIVTMRDNLKNPDLFVKKNVANLF